MICLLIGQYPANPSDVIIVNMRLICRVISGHMDGSLHLIGYNGIPAHSIRAHRKPISVMRCTADRVVTGGYDTGVKVHRIPDFHFVNSVFIHNGSLTALTLVEVGSYTHTHPTLYMLFAFHSLVYTQGDSLFPHV